MTAFDDRVERVKQTLVAAGYSSHDNPDTLVADLTWPAAILGHSILSGKSLQVMYGWEVTVRDGNTYRPDANEEIKTCIAGQNKIIETLKALLKDIPGINIRRVNSTIPGTAGYIWKKFNVAVHVQYLEGESK